MKMHEYEITRFVLRNAFCLAAKSGAAVCGADSQSFCTDRLICLHVFVTLVVT